MKTLEQYTAAEINDEAARLHRTYGPEGGLREYYAWIRKLRQDYFEARAATMDPDGQLTDWVGQMTAKHGPKVELHGVVYSWLAALAVARFGEDPNAVHPEGHARAGEPVWPAAFGPDDIIRAKRWLYDNKVPNGAAYITAEG